MLRWVIVLCSLISCLRAADDVIMISLGENCSSRAAMTTFSLKRESYPFASLIVPFSGLKACLQDDFAEFTNPKYFTPYIDKQSPVNKYGIVLAHSFPLKTVGYNQKGEPIIRLSPNWREQLPTVQEKYDRRIKRFREACRSDQKVVFFRYLGTTRAQAQWLCKHFSKKYPNLDFMILSISNATIPFPKVDDWGLKRVQHYHYNVNAKDHKEELRQIFQAAGLL